ncbi:flavodoxin domain-containing protein [uncultured Vagococcus sp.]|uniref:flavodoxin domain-containing protein n=1 Tax=uncultured Vagococcus sp. TaxID=189676 RepID=UPI0028D84D86|nr:flavodoxin domain-containing protein [uncultured Vagococcus sp.]
MNTLILYTSRHGTTKGYAKEIAAQLFPKGHVLNVKKINHHQINQFDTIVLGTPIYAGQPRRDMSDFCQKFHNELLTKQLYLFASGLASGDLATRELQGAYPESLQHHAEGKVFLGGAVDYSSLNLLEKGVVSLMPKDDFQIPNIKKVQQMSKLNRQQMVQFSQSIRPIF